MDLPLLESNRLTILLAAIADDYTGASDLANTWRKAGLRTIQTIGIPSSAVDFKDADAIVVSLKICSVPAEEAVAAALEANEFLRRLGVAHVMYKICSTFDSTDKGNIGQVTDALREAADGSWTIVSPAFPETGRTIYKGHLFVADVPLNESQLRHHPLNPMHDANLVRVLSKQTQNPVRLLDLQTLHRGEAACLDRIDAESGSPLSIVVDSISEANLDMAGELAIRSPVSTGASGLGAGLARAFRKDSATFSGASTLAAVGGLTAVIAGSCSARTLEQIAAVERDFPTLKLEAGQLIASSEGVTAAVKFAREHVGKGPILIAASGSPETVRATQARFGTNRAGAAIESALANIAQHLVEMGVRRLVVAGGETSGAIVDKLQVESFEVGDELAPGVPALRTVGRHGGELLMVLKSGNFGGLDFFREAIAHLR